MLLKSRGLSVADDATALHSLSQYGYYRLAGYFYPLRRIKPLGAIGRLNDFVEGASFELVLQLVEFDKRLRLLSLDAIESIEVAVRVAIAYRLGRFHPEAHLQPRLLDAGFVHGKPGRQSQYDLWKERFQTACDKSKEDFIKHHRTHYGGRMPIWVAVELWDFGLLSRFFSGMKKRDQDAIASEFGAVDGSILGSWLRAFNFVRNVAAHHSRLWNRTLTDLPRLPPIERCQYLAPLHSKAVQVYKLFGALTCLRLILRGINPSSSWHVEFTNHVRSFPETDLLSIASAGFQPGWENWPIWRC